MWYEWEMKGSGKKNVHLYVMSSRVWKEKQIGERVKNSVGNGKYKEKAEVSYIRAVDGLSAPLHLTGT